MIEIKNLNKQFNNQDLFKNFNLVVNDGEFLVISGTSGSGKTTLLNMIGCLEPFDSGEILVDGINIKNRKNKQIYLREIVGFVFQNFALMEEKTVEYNLKIIKPKYTSQMNIDEALEKVGLLEKKHSKVYTLSGGEQQRVALARLLIKKNKIILCDEPTGSLDRKNGENIISLLKQMNDDGKTVIMVTHDEKYKSIGGRLIEL